MTKKQRGCQPEEEAAIKRRLSRRPLVLTRHAQERLRLRCVRGACLAPALLPDVRKPGCGRWHQPAEPGLLLVMAPRCRPTNRS